MGYGSKPPRKPLLDALMEERQSVLDDTKTAAPPEEDVYDKVHAETKAAIADPEAEADELASLDAPVKPSEMKVALAPKRIETKPLDVSPPEVKEANMDDVNADYDKFAADQRAKLLQAIAKAKVEPETAPVASEPAPVAEAPVVDDVEAEPAPVNEAPADWTEHDKQLQAEVGVKKPLVSSAPAPTPAAAPAPEPEPSTPEEARRLDLRRASAALYSAFSGNPLKFEQDPATRGKDPMDPLSREKLLSEIAINNARLPQIKAQTSNIHTDNERAAQDQKAKADKVKADAEFRERKFAQDVVNATKRNELAVKRFAYGKDKDAANHIIKMGNETAKLSAYQVR
jgi:hypothetical protein